MEIRYNERVPEIKCKESQYVLANNRNINFGIEKDRSVINK